MIVIKTPFFVTILAAVSIIQFLDLHSKKYSTLFTLSFSFLKAQSLYFYNIESLASTICDHSNKIAIIFAQKQGKI